MKTRMILSYFIFLMLGGCNQSVLKDQTKVSGEQEAIKKILETIATDFLKSWEPPFNPEGAISLFTKSEDFHLIIDGYEISDYEDWASSVPNFMSDDNYFFNSYTHEIKNMETVVLSPKSGVVTIVYIWDSISKEGVHNRTPGAATLTCREEGNDWKIVHYHGSHDEPMEVRE